MFTGGHCAASGSAASCCRAARAGTAAAGAGACENVVGVDVVTADGELVHADADAERRPVLGRARRRARLPRRGHALPPAHVSAPADVPRHADVPARRPRAAAALAARRCCPRLDRRGRAGDGRDAASRTRRRRAAAAHDADRRRRDGGRAAARAVRRRSRAVRSSGTCAARPRSPRRTSRRRRRTPRATATPPTRSGPTRTPRRCARCCASSTATLPTDALVLDLVRLGARRASCRTWRSRSRRNVYLATYAIWPDAGRRRAPPRVGARAARRLAGTVGEGLYVGDSDFAAGERPTAT